MTLLQQGGEILNNLATGREQNLWRVFSPVVSRRYAAVEAVR